jgi:hypothetical protein
MDVPRRQPQAKRAMADLRDTARALYGGRGAPLTTPPLGATLE